MSVLSFDPAGHGGVSTVGAETLGGARNKINDVNAFNDNARRAASRRVTKNALRNVLGNENETTPLAIPTGDIGPDVEGTIVAENEGPIISFVNPESDEKDVAHAPDACTEKATSVKSRIVQGNEQLSGLIVDMGKRIKTHEQISERVRAMKAELEILKDREKNMPKPNTAEGMAQKALAMEAIESCSANMGGMESAVDELVSTIKRLKQQIIEIGDTDYDITRTLEDITGPSVA